MPRKTEFNAGLCSVPYYASELLHREGLLTPMTSMATLALQRCVLCHIRRGQPINGGEIAACTGLNNGVVYPGLGKMEDAGHIFSEPKGSGQMHDRWPTPDSLLSAIAAELNIPGTCREVLPPDLPPNR